MPIVHFLNVGNGDCSVIQHTSGHVTVIDVCNAKSVDQYGAMRDAIVKSISMLEKGVNGNFNQKAYPINPVQYLQDFGISSVFRFILTHPDMDHMGGIKTFFEEFAPINFWDTNNTAEKDFGDAGSGGYSEDDWKFYKRLRDSNPDSNPKRLTLYAGSVGQYWNQADGAASGGDGLHILAPTSGLVAQACNTDDYNDCSYVILYHTNGHKILFAGDSHDETWEHILSTYESAVSDVDLLIAPHHGRDSGRSWDFLDVVNPGLTLLGNANSEHLAYGAWYCRDLPFITNNQAGCVVVDAESDPMNVYVTCEAFARASNPYTFHSDRFRAHYWGTITKKVALQALSARRG